MGREVSESCVDSLLTEMVSMYCSRLYANKPELAASRIDAIGYQVGHQLSERYTSAHSITITFNLIAFPFSALNSLGLSVISRFGLWI